LSRGKKIFVFPVELDFLATFYILKKTLVFYPEAEKEKYFRQRLRPRRTHKPLS